MKDRIYVMDVEYGLLKNKDDRIKIFDLPFHKRMEKHLTEAIDSIWYYKREEYERWLYHIKKCDKKNFLVGTII